MGSNPKVIEFMMGLTKDEKAVVACKSKMTLQSAATTREDAKWNPLFYFKVDRAFVGIMPHMEYISIIFNRGTELDDLHHV
jgi:hypothetical protein